MSDRASGLVLPVSILLWWYESSNPSEGSGLTFAFANGSVFSIE